ncbi:unnamed protein product [Rhodiola kirilowii]
MWIIDSGATDHITPYAHLLKNVKELDSPYGVVIPNGDTDSTTRTIQGIGELTEGLYQLKPALNRACFSLKTNKNVVQLWHHRLGNVPIAKMLHKLSANIPSLKCTGDIDVYCDICPKARQTRLPFNDSNTVSSSLFDLVHCDIWGPFGTPTMTGAGYFLTIVDDFSRCTWVYLMQN